MNLSNMVLPQGIIRFTLEIIFNILQSVITLSLVTFAPSMTMS